MTVISQKGGSFSLSLVTKEDQLACHRLNRRSSWTFFIHNVQSPSEIIGTTAKNGVVPDATSNEQPI